MNNLDINADITYFVVCYWKQEDGKNHLREFGPRFSHKQKAVEALKDCLILADSEKPFIMRGTAEYTLGNLADMQARDELIKTIH